MCNCLVGAFKFTPNFSREVFRLTFQNLFDIYNQPYPNDLTKPILFRYIMTDVAFGALETTYGGTYALSLLPKIYNFINSSVNDKLHFITRNTLYLSNNWRL